MRVEVSDSQYSLVTSKWLVWIEHSVGSHLRSNDELDVVSDWESSILGLMVLNLDELDLGNSPRLVVSLMAFPEGNWLVVHVSSTRYIKAESFVVSDVSLTARVEVESLIGLTSPLSNDGCSSNVECMSLLVRYDEVSIGSRSHGLSSWVKSEPGSLVVRVGVLDSKSELTVTNVFIPEELSVAVHLGFKKESYSVSNRLDSCISLLYFSSDSISGRINRLLQIGVQLSVDSVVNI